MPGVCGGSWESVSAWRLRLYHTFEIDPLIQTMVLRSDDKGAVPPYFSSEPLLHTVPGQFAFWGPAHRGGSEHTGGGGQAGLPAPSPRSRIGSYVGCGGHDGTAGDRSVRSRRVLVLAAGGGYTPFLAFLRSQ